MTKAKAVTVGGQYEIMGTLPTDFSIPDIVGVDYYNRGSIRIRRRKTCLTPPSRGKRAGIEYLSGKARSRLMWVVKETDVEFRSLLTLTYGATWPSDGKRCKAHLDTFLKWVRRNVSTSYLWFIEFQKRGAPHYHIMLDVDAGDRFEMAVTWARIAEEDTWMRVKMVQVHAHEKSWENIRQAEGARRYVAKYALKTYQKKVPREYQNVGRFWGASRDVKAAIPEPMEVEMDEDNLRRLLTSLDHRCAKWDILPELIFGLDNVTSTG